MDNDQERAEKDRKEKLQWIAERLAAVFPGFYGSVKFNLQNGKVVNVNVEESIRLS